jgi:cytochrome c-type biogenesis protein CcmH
MRAVSRRWWFALLLACGMGLTPMAFAQGGPAAADAPLTFTSNAEEARFHALVAELRCVMCQNQSLADSNAMIARDLRREVLDLMRQGKSDAQIKEFLVERYGQFVLYRPQVRTGTWLLWFGPVVLLLVGGLVVARIVRQHGSRTTPPDDGQEW